MSDTRVNNDPDGLECYSDHGHDIRFYGACGMCGSRDENVIGHVAPHMQRVKGKDPVDAARMVVETGSAMLFDGVMLDLFSASAIVGVYEKLTRETTRAKLRGMSLPEAVDLCFRLIQKLGG